MKKLIPAYVLSFVIAFMLFIIEPITMFVNNKNDFHFNFSNILKPVLIIFLITFVILSLIYTVIYFINKKYSNKMKFFNVVMIISYILFIVAYIQGNYMTGNLPALDGSNIVWSSYVLENIIIIIILLALAAAYIYFIKKYKYEKVIKTSNYIVLAIFAMLISGFLPALLNNGLYENNKLIAITNRNINKVSNNKNFFILVLDAADSKTFSNELEKSEYKDILKDFTYYPDTLSMFVFTRDSIPYMLSGIPNLNETDYVPYYNKAMDESPFIDKLIENKYEINLYEPDLEWTTEKSKVVQNIEVYDKSFSNMCYAKQQVKYDLFKYLPYFLKSFSKIDSFNMNYCKTAVVPDNFSFFDKDLYDMINNNELEKIDDKYFSFIHVDGAHVPFDINENFERIENGTYKQKINASIKIVNNYLERLRASGKYDNSVIIVMADHGFVDGSEGTRANPILYIKGINEHHDMKVSDKAVSYADLMDAYNDLLNGEKSTELFSNIPNNRERKYLWYKYSKENHKVEIATKGKAWEYEKEYKTGKEFNR